jgi:hypothetical protein
VDLDVRSLGATSLLEDLLAGGDDDDDYDLRVRSLDSAVCLISIYPIILVLVVTGGVSLFPFFFPRGWCVCKYPLGRASLFIYLSPSDNGTSAFGDRNIQNIDGQFPARTSTLASSTTTTTTTTKPPRPPSHSHTRVYILLCQDLLKFVTDGFASPGASGKLQPTHLLQQLPSPIP